MSVRVIDKMPIFKRSLYSVLDDALQEGARDILIKSRNRAPYDKGGLRGEKEPITTPRKLARRVSYNIEYARFQEFGGDSKRRVRHYTTPGTGAHYLKSSGDEVTKNMKATFKKHAMRARA